MTLDSPGVVVLDTSAVPDVYIGLRARNSNAEPTLVLPGRAQNSVRVLIPDDRAAPWGFHDATLVDMTGATGPSVSKEELSTLWRQWPVSLVVGMSKRQSDLELMRRDCKARFSSGLGPIVEVPGVLVLTVEGHSTRLYRSRPPEAQCG